jgi:S1-C subfamily serine protease/Flp pilus assembly protein TadD
MMHAVSGETPLIGRAGHPEALSPIESRPPAVQQLRARLAILTAIYCRFGGSARKRQVTPLHAPHLAMPVNLDIYRAVVRLTYSVGPDGDISLGSGVVFSPTGLVITNNHVIEDSDFGTAFGKITIGSLDRIDRAATNEAPAEVVIRNETYDLAVVRITEAAPMHFIDILRTPAIDLSFMERRLRVLGYPPLGGGTITVTRGIMSGFDDAGNLKTDAEINPGNSGGAALDDMDTFLGIPSFIFADATGKLGFIISVDRIKEWFGTALKSGLPENTQQLANAFVKSNLNFADNNLDQSNNYPRILSKFAAVETLLSKEEYKKSFRHIEFILSKRPRSALAYHYLGNALMGLGRHLEAAAQFRTSLAYNPNHIPALGNLGVTLIHLGRYAEALQIFEQIIDSTNNPAELLPSYNNIAQIYENAGQTALAGLYKQKASELSAAAAERLSKYRPQHPPGDRLAALANAMVNAEIEIEDENT